MSLLNLNAARQGLILAGSLSLYSGTALAQPIGSAVPPAVGSAAPAPIEATPPPPTNPEGRAGIATLCIEKRSYVDYAAKIIRTPNIYIEEMPTEGINTGYIEGNAVSMKWKDFLNPTDPKKKAWLEDTDIPEQAEAAIKLVIKLDKDKNGIVSRSEFETGEKGKSHDDQLTDMAFLKSLECDNLFFMEGALNTVDPNKFQEVTDLKTANTLLQAKFDLTASALEDSQDRMHEQFTLLMVLAGVSAVTSIGMIVSMVRHRRHRKRTEGAAQPKTEPTPPKPKTEEAAAKVTGDGYTDVLGHLAGEGKDAPSPEVLEAINDSKEASAEAPKTDAAPVSFSSLPEKDPEGPAKA